MQLNLLVRRVKKEEAAQGRNKQIPGPPTMQLGRDNN